VEEAKAYLMGCGAKERERYEKEISLSFVNNGAKCIWLFSKIPSGPM